MGKNSPDASIFDLSELFHQNETGSLHRHSYICFLPSGMRNTSLWWLRPCRQLCGELRPELGQ